MSSQVHHNWTSGSGSEFTLPRTEMLPLNRGMKATAERPGPIAGLSSMGTTPQPRDARQAQTAEEPRITVNITHGIAASPSGIKRLDSRRVALQNSEAGITPEAPDTSVVSSIGTWLSHRDDHLQYYLSHGGEKLCGLELPCREDSQANKSIEAFIQSLTDATVINIQMTSSSPHFEIRG